MPRIRTMKLHRWLWVAWNENDLGETFYPRLGLTEERARTRVEIALWEARS